MTSNDEDSDSSVDGYDSVNGQWISAKDNSKWITANRAKRKKKINSGMSLKVCNNGNGEIEQVNKRGQMFLNHNSPEPLKTIHSPESSDACHSDSYERLKICKGGHEISQCGVPVRSEDTGVQCYRCRSWYHIECQGVSKQAHSALLQHEPLCWLCIECQSQIRQNSCSLIKRRQMILW